MAIPRFTPSDLGGQNFTHNPGSVATAIETSFYRAQENVRQNEESDRADTRLAMQQEQFEYEKTIRPLREQALRLGLSSDLLGIQAQGADLAFKQGSIQAQQMELAANQGVLQSFQSNPTIQKGLEAALRIYGGTPGGEAQQGTSVPSSDPNVDRALRMSGADAGLPQGDTGADVQNPLLPNIQERGETSSTPQSASKGGLPSVADTDAEYLADAYLEAVDIAKDVVKANGGNVNKANESIVRKSQSIQLAAMSNPRVKAIVETKQAERTRVQMRQDIEGMPLAVREYMSRVIPEPSSSNPEAVNMARQSRLKQVTDYYQNPTRWLSDHGLVSQVTRGDMSQSQRTAQVSTWLKAANTAVGNDPLLVRQNAAVAQAALMNMNVSLPIVQPSTSIVPEPADRLDITAYYAALRRAAGEDEDELARLGAEEAAAIKNPDKFRRPESSSEVVPPASRFQQAVR